MFGYEHRRENLLPRPAFARRIAAHGGAVVGLAAVSLGIGALGYRAFGSMGWVDAFYNASMILTGMGPVTAMTTTTGKLFASFFALYSGLVFLATGGILLAPFVHRLIHRLHLDRRDGP